MCPIKAIAGGRCDIGPPRKVVHRAGFIILAHQQASSFARRARICIRVSIRIWGTLCLCLDLRPSAGHCVDARCNGAVCWTVPRANRMSPPPPCNPPSGRQHWSRQDAGPRMVRENSGRIAPTGCRKCVPRVSGLVEQRLFTRAARSRPGTRSKDRSAAVPKARCSRRGGAGARQRDARASPPACQPPSPTLTSQRAATEAKTRSDCSLRFQARPIWPRKASRGADSISIMRPSATPIDGIVVPLS